ncbi:MAG: hypothetical protein F6K42_27455 [Leptolyngbya sp. SIO1D8]|nr:hypothetical protein [Leptolyngbya sp. SIO1D8]
MALQHERSFLYRQVWFESAQFATQMLYAIAYPIDYKVSDGDGGAISKQQLSNSVFTWHPLIDL